MTVIKRDEHGHLPAEVTDNPASTVNPGSVCPGCAATATGVVETNAECPTGDHQPGENGVSCVTVEVNHEEGCDKPMNVPGDDDPDQAIGGYTGA